MLRDNLPLLFMPIHLERCRSLYEAPHSRLLLFPHRALAAPRARRLPGQFCRSYHTDVPHPEDPALGDADWGTWTVKNAADQNANEPWTGTRVFRRWVEIPQKINGYVTRGSRVCLDLRFRSKSTLMITVFSNTAT